MPCVWNERDIYFLIVINKSVVLGFGAREKTRHCGRRRCRCRVGCAPFPIWIRFTQISLHITPFKNSSGLLCFGLRSSTRAQPRQTSRQGDSIVRPECACKVSYYTDSKSKYVLMRQAPKRETRKFGFIGVGTINSCVIRGLIENTEMVQRLAS